MILYNSTFPKNIFLDLHLKMTVTFKSCLNNMSLLIKGRKRKFIYIFKKKSSSSAKTRDRLYSVIITLSFPFSLVSNFRDYFLSRASKQHHTFSRVDRKGLR